jgi:hypothetical protein
MHKSHNTLNKRKRRPSLYNKPIIDPNHIDVLHTLLFELFIILDIPRYMRITRRSERPWYTDLFDPPIISDSQSNSC